MKIKVDMIQVLLSAALFYLPLSAINRPLINAEAISQIDFRDLDQIRENHSPLWIFQDGEPDDEVDIWLSFHEGARVISEPHCDIPDTHRITKRLLETMKIANIEKHLFPGDGDPETVDRLIDELKTLKDHSLRIHITAAAPTLKEIIDREPALLAKKIDRISAFAGFKRLPCEVGAFAGNPEVYYTSFNLASHIEAGRALFHFADTHRVPLYIFSSDNLQFPRHICFDLPAKIRSLDLPMSDRLLEDIETWNQISIHGPLMQILREAAIQSGYNPDDLMRGEMTPADLIAGVFDEAFPLLEVQSRGLSNIEITDEPHYKNGKPLKARAALFSFDPDSTIRYVDSYQLRGIEAEGSFSFEAILTYLLDQQKTEPLRKVSK